MTDKPYDHLNRLLETFVNDVLIEAKRTGLERHEIGMLFQACTQKMMAFVVEGYGATPFGASQFVEFALKRAAERFFLDQASKHRDTERHNRMANVFVQKVIGDAVRDGASMEGLCVIFESCVLGFADFLVLNYKVKPSEAFDYVDAAHNRAIERFTRLRGDI